MEVSGVSAHHVRRSADAYEYFGNQNLCNVVANSMNLDAHIRTLAGQINSKRPSKKVEFIVFGDADSSGH
ncbi:MAG: hypothetical protein ACI84C_000866 [Flavobacteriales bacterium]